MEDGGTRRRGREDRGTGTAGVSQKDSCIKGGKRTTRQPGPLLPSLFYVTRVCVLNCGLAHAGRYMAPRTPPAGQTVGRALGGRVIHIGPDTRPVDTRRTAEPQRPQLLSRLTCQDSGWRGEELYGKQNDYHNFYHSTDKKPTSTSSSCHPWPPQARRPQARRRGQTCTSGRTCRSTDGRSEPP